MFVAYVGAFAAIIAFSLVAAGIVHGLNPDLPEHAVFEASPDSSPAPSRRPRRSC